MFTEAHMGYEFRRKHRSARTCRLNIEQCFNCELEAGFCARGPGIGSMHRYWLEFITDCYWNHYNNK